VVASARRQPKKLDVPITWCYSLEPEGFKVSISIEASDKTISCSNTMPWDDFIQGLIMGWDLYRKNNPELTETLQQFIQQQIVDGNYAPGCSVGDV
jgi:hypothetical protein